MATPALTSPPAVDVTLSLFGGTDTEISPSDVPEGLSPDNQDMNFLPGNTSSRPCLAKLFNTPFPGSVSVLYEKTYVQPNNDPLNLYLTSDGKLWVEDVVNSPKTYTQIGNTTPQLYGQSVSGFGREYIAISDLLHGQGIPLQFDGTNLDRVTQDGPGAPPQVIDDSAAFAIEASPNGIIVPATAGVLTASQVGNLVTITYTLPGDFFLQGAQLTAAAKQVLTVKVAGVGAGYNGTFQVATLAQLLTGTLTYISPTAGLGPLGAGGTVAFSVVEIVMATAQPYSPSDWGVTSLTISGAGVAGYDGTWLILFTLDLGGNHDIYINFPTFGLGASGNGQFVTFGLFPIGVHQVVQMFLTRSGYLTRPSPAFSWTAAGGLRAIFTNLAIGPPNTVARVLALTGAGGDNFFTLVTTPQIAGQVVGSSLLIPDNTTTQVTLSLADNTLFAGIPIDVIGNDLFDQVVLGTPMGFFTFASRLLTWGDWNKVENFLNMGFCGGYLSGVLTQPLGWTVATAGGLLVNGGSWGSGMSWQITGDGSGNAVGTLTQPAWQDSFSDPILSPNTTYIARFWAKVSGTFAGSVTIDFYDTGSATVLASASVLCSTMSIDGGFVQATFNAATPATIPAGTILRFSETGMPNADTVILGELEIIFSSNPYRNNLARVSYAINPEAFAQTTGNLGPADDDSPIQNFSLQQNVGELHTSEATHEFQDTAYEPGDAANGWPVNALTHSVGALSLKSCDPGKFGAGDSAEDWDVIASKNGVYIHLGKTFYKVAQEMSRTVGTAPTAVTWDDINWTAQKTIWVKNDPNARRIYIGVPIGEVIVPNTVFVMDYREMDTAAQIAAALPIHITLTGKMKSSDMTRKWTRWNVKASCGEILVRSGNQRTFFLGGGSGTSVGGVAFGNVYSLNDVLLTDDDYGQMFPYYVTYAFLDHDQEQMFQLGAARKLYKHISAFITGVGYVTITPLVNSLQNLLPPTTPRPLQADNTILSAQDYDLEWTTGIRGQRVFFRIDVIPLPGTTDVKMQLQKLIVRVQKDPVALFRSSGV